MGSELDETDFSHLRHRMVEEQLRSRGLADERVLAAMDSVPRHLFVRSSERHAAYDDSPLPIGLGQTISQPYIVACMTGLLNLQPNHKVLEIGTGSGYQAAILATLAAEVWTVERHAELARQADELLRSLGYANVRVIAGDGTVGFPEAAPFDAIIVTAAAPHVPEALRGQLGPGGRMVIPVAAGYAEDLKLIERLPDEPPAKAPAPANISTPRTAPEPRFRETSILGCTFVPLIGEQGYPK
jgi:protein-L-isoaspartate(D-aspartate) O-methyltransferase